MNQAPLDEAAHRRLMEAQALAGQRAAARQTYETCRAILQTELGIDPSPETKHLRLTIDDLRFASANRKSKTRTERSRGIVNRQSADLLSSVAPPNIAVWLSCFTWQMGDNSRWSLSPGKPVSVKHAWLENFCTAWPCKGWIYCVGGLLKRGGRLPYQPLIDALRECLERENAPDDLLADVWLAELSRLLPELRDRYPDLPPPATDENLARIRLPEAVTRLGQALTARRSLALLIDDLQWADDASLDVLRYVCRAWTTSNLSILILLTLRSEALATVPEIESWLAALGREVALTRLMLNALTAAETEELVLVLTEQQRRKGAGEQGSELIPSTPLPPGSSAHFATWLYQETAGQPFFISETIRALPEQNWTKGKLLPEGLLPPGVRQVILAQLKVLPDNATALLTAAAVLGRPCAFEGLCQITGLSELTALPDLETLLNHRLLLETNDLLRPYHFAHDKIRDVVYTEAGDARRQVYHRRALAALEVATSHPELNRRVAELAHHALAARLPEAAFRYSLAAGDEAMRLFAIRDAIIHYEQARHQLSINNEQLSISTRSVQSQS